MADVITITSERLRDCAREFGGTVLECRDYIAAQHPSDQVALFILEYHGNGMWNLSPKEQQ